MMRVRAKKNYWQARNPFVVAIVIGARVSPWPSIEREWSGPELKATELSRYGGAARRRRPPCRPRTEVCTLYDELVL